MTMLVHETSLHNESSHVQECLLTAEANLVAKFLKCGSNSARADFGTSSIALLRAAVCFVTVLSWLLSMFHLLKIATDSNARLAKPRQTADMVDVASHGDATLAAADCHTKRGSLNVRSSMAIVFSSSRARVIH